MAERDIRFLLVFLVVALAVLVWIQHQKCNAIPNEGALKIDHFQTEGQESSQLDSRVNTVGGGAMTQKNEVVDSENAAKDKNANASKIIDKILMNDRQPNPELDSLIGGEELSQLRSSFKNPLPENVDQQRFDLGSEQSVLDKLIREVQTGNDLVVDNARQDVYRSKSRSIDAVPQGKARMPFNYANSKIRSDFNFDGSPSQTSQDELNSLYDDAQVFRNNEYNTNSDFKGFSETSDNYGSADLANFTNNNAQTQQQKVMQLYNSNEYLPNNDMLDKKLVKGFQILDNPVAVSNPNLIPVLKSIPVSSVLGSNKNATYDIRAEPPNPKTVVSPFLNSSIMPDIYATQRGCL